MIPGNKEQMNEREEQALLKELMPGFDKEQEWQQLQGKLSPVKGRNITLVTMRIAAALVLLAGCAGLVWLLATNRQEPAIAINETNIAGLAVIERQDAPTNSVLDINGNPVPDTVKSDEKQINVNTPVSTDVKNVNGTKIATVKKYAIAHSINNNKNGSEKYFNYYLANEFVCNGTQCPLEICIVQTFNCNNKKANAVATCNTIYPDEAKQLRYKAPDKKGKGCKVTIDEIRIRRVSTGETIVLNANSKPSTAEDLFSCITGQEKCNILAGIFDEDCDSRCKPDDLSIRNSQGNLILE